MYRKFRNVPIFKDFPPICPYFLGFRVGKYVNAVEGNRNRQFLVNTILSDFWPNDWQVKVHRFFSPRHSRNSGIN